MDPPRVSNMMIRSLLLAAVSLAVFSGPVLSAQVDWTEVKPRTLPGKRSSHAFAADANSLVAFGGRPAQGLLWYTDTWRYIGGTWLNLNPSTSPPPRWFPAMSWDSTRNRLVLFGGQDVQSGFRNDTWELLGRIWIPVTTTNSPPKRGRHAQSFDRKRNVTVVFGGWNGFNLYADTWIYDGKDWSKVTTPTAPPARHSATMAYDEARDVHVMTGGATAFNATGVFQDTWEFDGTKWTQVRPTAQPRKLFLSSMTYDEARQRIVMFGGTSPGWAYRDEVVEYDGKTWTTRKTTTKPMPRQTVIAYMQGKVWAFSGFNNLSKQLPDFWVYGPKDPATFVTSGTACAGSAGAPELEAKTLPWIGDVFELEASPVGALPTLVSIGFSKTSWGAFSLPLPLAGAGASGCTLYCGLDVIGPAFASGGLARISLPVPNVASLIGGRMFHQALVVDAAANGLGIAFSNLGEAQFGSR